MPYIKQVRRTDIDTLVQQLVQHIHCAEDLNYTITRLALRYLIDSGLTYDNINTLQGVLSGVVREIARRVEFPYEDVKILQNGDVPEYKELQAEISELYLTVELP